MDRRQRKTREAIFSAFSELIRSRRYESITVQDIIDRADIGRSTFYSHFETKDHLLKAICSDIFVHIIEGESCGYDEKNDTLLSKLTHILWHFEAKKHDIRGILSSQSSEIFMKYLHDYLDRIFTIYADNFHIKVPTEYLKNHLTSSFCETVRWWIKQSPETSPDKIADFYFEVTGTH